MLKYLDHDNNTISQTTDDGRSVVVFDRGSPGFDALALQNPAPYETPPLTIDDYRQAIDAHVEATARSRQYNSAAHMAGYVASTVPEWSAEAIAFVAWRDQVWVTAIGMLELEPTIPAIDDVIAALPQIQWPE